VSLVVVTGGTRSGKSAHAERLAAATGLPVRYVATADAADPAMRGRIAAHTARRPAGWTTVEAPAALAEALAGADGVCVLLDGLGSWVAARMHHAGAFEDPDRLASVPTDVLAGVDAAVQACAQVAVTIVVAEHAGGGVLPPDAASRAWLDLLGEATQRFAATAERVDVVVAGRVLTAGPSVGRDITGRVPTAGPPHPRDVAGPDARPGGAARAALRRHGDRDVLPGDADHAVNVVAGGPPPWLRAALDAALAAHVDHYPREEAAVGAVAALHGRDPREVVPTNGAAEALWLLAPALGPRLAACVHPAFTESEAALHAHGVPVVRVQRDPDRAFALDPAAVPEAADLVVVGNPASPSGTLDPAAAILALRRPGRVVVVDEAFMDLVPGEPGTLARVALDDVIVVRSLTKVLSVAGLRVGYAIAAPALADRLRAVRPPWSANALALAALAAAAAHPAEIAAIADRSAAGRADLSARLAAIAGVRVWPAAANFVLVEVADGPAVVAALRSEAIAVRPAGSFPGLDDRHIRITARDAAANARVADVIGAAVGVPA